MPALKPTRFEARITWLGRVPHRDADEIETLALNEMALEFGGMAGEVHAGRTRPSCSRVLSQHPRNTEIANVRQLSLLSAEELALIAQRMETDRLDPAWLGASVVLDGIPDFTHLPPSSRLQGPDGVTLVVDMENRPCQLPAKTIAQHDRDLGRRFKPAAEGLRGVTAWVERPGKLRLGDTMRLHVPDQRAWDYLAEARA
ncbi:MOSC domain-containing protein [Mesobacterium pallidum]|uniref:MOSC domain-containing protein n=1 Tax=Mesobacterium pallidum TaxID=2872037 RepID=UPI001EE29838|nr:MOSC domain-containing protein [Mesobacterium pallidum]